MRWDLFANRSELNGDKAITPPSIAPVAMNAFMGGQCGSVSLGSTIKWLLDSFSMKTEEIAGAQECQAFISLVDVCHKRRKSSSSFRVSAIHQRATHRGRHHCHICLIQRLANAVASCQ